jgi:hypothetical protein
MVLHLYVNLFFLVFNTLGDLGESNSRPLAPKASIIPLDQSPNHNLYVLLLFLFFLGFEMIISYIHLAEASAAAPPTTLFEK